VVFFIRASFFLSGRQNLKPSDFRGILQKRALAGIIQIDENQKKISVRLAERE
jgi:hypothetical protein